MAEMTPTYAAYRQSLEARGITEAEDLAKKRGNKRIIDTKPFTDRMEELFSRSEGLNDIARKDFPEMRWVVKELLPRGTFCLFSGASKIGKTWLSLQLASAVSLGLPFLGNPDYPCEQSEVLLLSLQLSPRQLHDRMETAGILADDRVKVLPEFPRGPVALDAIRYWVSLNPECKLVIIDMLEQVRDRDALHENSYSENVRELAQWKKLAQELDICILGLTHDRKMRTDDFVNAVMGSVGAVGSSGVIWSLKKTARNRTDAILYATGWDVKDFDLPLLFDETKGWQLLDGTATERQQSEERQAILEVLEGVDEPMTAKDIAMALEKNYNTTRWMLYQMERDRQVSKPSRGKYMALKQTTKQTNNTNIQTYQQL